MFSDNVTQIDNEFWFIPVDMLTLMLSFSIVYLNILCLLVIFIDKSCHTVPMILVGNTCLSSLFVGLSMISFSMFTLKNDLNQIEYKDSYCVVRSYFGYVTFAVFNCSFLLQSLYRYVIVVYPIHFFWQTIRVQCLLIGLSWIYSFIYCLPFLFTNSIVYDFNDQICELLLRPTFAKIYSICFSTVLPISLVIYIYRKLARYVREIGKIAMPSNTLIRARNHLKVVQRVVAEIIILIAVCCPYMFIIFLSFMNQAPKYKLRFAYIFVNSSILCVLIGLIQYTEPLKKSLLKFFDKKPNAVASTVS